KVPNLVPYTAIGRKAFFLCGGTSSQTRRVIKTHMDNLGFAEEHRAVLVSVAAYGYNVIEGDVPKFSNVLGSLAANIDARLGHDSNRVWVQSMRFDSSR